MANLKTYTISKKVGKQTFKEENVTDISFGKWLINQKINNRNNHLKSNGNWIRRNKNDLSFHYIDTTKPKWFTVVDEWKSYSDYAYTSSGLNSLQRECLIIDDDGNSFGQETLNAINKTPIIINYQRVKPNGHSQTGILIYPIHVRHAKTLHRNVVNQMQVFTSNEWKYVKTWSKFLKKEEIICSKKINKKTLIDMNKLYLTTVRLLNNNFCGDLGFTGFCQQNPFSIADEGKTTWFDETHRYRLGTIFCILLEHTINKTFEFKKKSSSPRTFGNSSIDYIIVENKEEIEQINNKLITLSVQFNENYRKSIDGAIFKYIAEVKQYCYRKNKELTTKYALKCILNRSDITKDYSFKDIVEHTTHCVDYINSHFNPKLIGYTIEQRRLGSMIKKVNSLKKWFDIKALKEMGLTNITIAKNLGINEKTVRRLLNKTVEDFDIDSLIDSVSSIKKYRDLYMFLIETVMKLKYSDVRVNEMNEDERLQYENIRCRAEHIRNTILVRNNNNVLMQKVS